MQKKRKTKMNRYGEKRNKAKERDEETEERVRKNKGVG